MLLAEPAGTSVQAFVALGANLGDMLATLQSAVLALAALPGTRVRRSSSVYRSAALGAVGPDYLNAVVELQTVLDAHGLLAKLQAIEAEHGRERPFLNAPRTLDLDLLLYGTERIATATLTVPHPRMLERAFVLLPLSEIAPQCVAEDRLNAVLRQSVHRLEACLHLSE